MPEAVDFLPFSFDHVIAQKHGGPTAESNLAWSCYRCNSYKGPNIAGIDSETGQITPLFNPRTMSWQEHFAWNGSELTGRTAIGRATIEVLRINDPQRIELRRLLRAEGVFPQSP
jgi:hypothetical protein